jgi:hypothetical protein
MPMQDVPIPSPEGVEKMKAYYREKLGMDVSAQDAYEALFGIMRFIRATPIQGVPLWR